MQQYGRIFIRDEIRLLNSWRLAEEGFVETHRYRSSTGVHDYSFANSRDVIEEQLIKSINFSLVVCRPVTFTPITGELDGVPLLDLNIRTTYCTRSSIAFSPPATSMLDARCGLLPSHPDVPRKINPSKPKHDNDQAVTRLLLLSTRDPFASPDRQGKQDETEMRGFHWHDHQYIYIASVVRIGIKVKSAA